MSGKNEQISQLQKTESLSATDIFLTSNQLTDEIYTSKKVDLDLLGNETVEKFENISAAYLSATWTFTSGVSIPTKTVKEADESGYLSCVTNVDYLSSSFFKILSDLSATLFKKCIIPSYVGEVVYTTKLTSEQKMKRYYGDWTSWKQLPGRFIMATDYTLFKTTNITGGEFYNTIPVTGIPPHTHKFIPQDNTKPLEATVVLTSEKTDAVAVANTSKPMRLATHEDKGQFGVKISRHKPDSAAFGATLYGNQSKATITTESITNRNKPHNNMPPFYSVYIWERIK